MSDDTEAEDEGDDDGLEPITTAPLIESEDYDDGLTPISTDFESRSRDRDSDDIGRR